MKKTEFPDVKAIETLLIYYALHIFVRITIIKVLTHSAHRIE